MMRRAIHRPRPPARDILFQQARSNAQDFRFDGATADVFDDMLERSVPFYDEVQRMIVEMAHSFAQDGSRVYDLGCSTGTTMASLAQALAGRPVRIIGVDSSAPMLDKARAKLRRAGVWKRCGLQQADLDRNCAVKDASVVIMNLTLQFVRPLHRDRMIATIHRGLRHDGCLILCEKIVAPRSSLGRLFVDLYHAYKERQGYSKLEVARKREALENVLIPYHFAENVELLRRNGFAIVEEFFRWYNFCGIIAVKTCARARASR